MEAAGVSTLDSEEEGNIDGKPASKVLAERLCSDLSDASLKKEETVILHTKETTKQRKEREKYPESGIVTLFPPDMGFKNTTKEKKTT